MRTRSSIRRASARAAAWPLPWCTRIDSAICSPAVKTGLSEVIGSWKIIAISAPRISRISALEACARSRIAPVRRRNSIRPVAILPPPCSTRRIRASEVTDLPEPDSPTIARVSPASTWKDRSRTASTVRSEVAKRTVRSETDRMRRSGRISDGGEAGAGKEDGDTVGTQKMAVEGVSPARTRPRYMPAVLNGMATRPRASTAMRPPWPPSGVSPSRTVACAAASRSRPA